MNETPPSGINYRTVLITTIVSAAATFGVIALLIDIFEKKQEAKETTFRVVELDDTTTDPAIWGKNFPQQYDDYSKTVDMVRTRYGGSEAIPRDPGSEDPREVVAQSKLDHLPELKRLWAGYSFAQDFREDRGHAYMLSDQIHTERQEVASQPGTCLQCHASVYVPMMELGEGDLMAGFEALNQMTYDKAVDHVSHPVSCIDCHDPDSMELRVTRPAFMEGIQTLKEQAGVSDYEVNRDATHQELRTYVCAQCHVEYYFQGDKKRLTFPWSKGLKADQILAYFDEIEFKDWTHAETEAPMLKAQHPEYELWSQGTHAKAGVTCSDCHMPYKRIGAKKVSDHHVRSPLLNINRACQTCHKGSEEELLSRAESIQTRHTELRDLALDAIIDLIDSINAAQEAGVDEQKLKVARNYQRKATFLCDFVEAENSSGFHADQEAARVLGLSLNYARLGEKSLMQKKDGK
ncbi:MAG: ammonia-forming cytochrome c nitrite reductase subunit c552 [Planctomycetaceae bacterium]|nr:ammonia-forming cytochrome c nitrite reductase subunit c552 [Planctomycetaceae bacterium]